MIEEFVITDLFTDKRLDLALAKKYPDFSRSAMANLIKGEQVKVSKITAKPSYILKVGDTVEINFPTKTNTALEAEKIDLNIIYEDDDVIVINKQPGIVVHPGAGNPTGTIVNAVMAHFPKIKDVVYEKGNLISESRPGIVHRLDKDTSGVMIIAKNSRAMHSLSRQIQNRHVKKTYLALCYKWPKNETGHLVNYLGRHHLNRKMVTDVGAEKGREAISDYLVKDYYNYDKNKLSLLEYSIQTGRTHQIRVQSKLMGNPVMGDTVYGSKESAKMSNSLKISRQLLHAYQLSITLPSENKASTFTAPIPEDFKKVLGKLHKED